MPRSREPSVYGSTTVDRFDALFHQHAHGKGYSLEAFSTEGLVTARLDPAVSGSARYEAGPAKSKAAMAGVLPSPAMRDRGDIMISATTTRHEAHLEQPISKDVSVARGLLDREALLQTLDRAVTRRITIISALRLGAASVRWRRSPDTACFGWS